MSKYISVKVVDVDTSTKVKSKTTGEDMYKVTYADGYVSHVPCRIFKEKYVPISKTDIKLINNYE